MFQFCVKELEHAKVHLSYESSVAEGDFYGRMTAPVCMFVLAKLMLNHAIYTGTESQAYYNKCIEYCKEIENLSYQLEDFYTDNFKVYNENSKENIFTIPMDKYLYANQQQNMYRSYHYRHAAAFGFTGENGTCATKSVLNIFHYGQDDVDIRFFYNYYSGMLYDLYGDEILDRTGQPLQYYPDEVQLDLSGSPYVETAGARMHKYEIDKNAPKDGKLMDNDIVLFRFADVLLMHAEACLRTGQIDEGQEYFNMVRERVDMPLRQLTLESLLDERLLELCWEGWRRQDLIRFGKYKSLYQGNDAIDESDGHTTVFPIPADVLALNPNLTQNPGY